MKIIIILSILATLNMITCLNKKNNYEDPLAIDSKIFEDGFSNNEDFANAPGFLQHQDNFDVGYDESYNSRRENKMKKKYEKKKYQPGYLDPFAGVSDFTDFLRFSESSQSDDYFNPREKKSDPNNPGKELEMIRQEGLSNGIVLSGNKRTANFETGEFPEMFTDLTKE